MLCAPFWSFLIAFVRHDARIAPQKSNKTVSKKHHKSSAKISKQHRTIADLEGTADVLDHHIMEAIAYRNLDRPTYLGSF